MPIPIACSPSSSNGSAMQHTNLSSPPCPHLAPTSAAAPTETAATTPSSSTTENSANNTQQLLHQHHNSTNFLSNENLNLLLRSISTTTPATRQPSAMSLPNALDHIAQITAHLTNMKSRPVIFLDYDGTLSPIVDDPETAFMPATISVALSAISARFTTAIVTGRSKKKVMELVQLDDIIYAGSHGFDIHSPDGRVSHRVAGDYIPLMKRAAQELRMLALRYPGTHVEDNFLSVTLHYRHLTDRSLGLHLKNEVNQLASRYGVMRHDGKMVHELRPPHDWNKGRAVHYLLSELDLTAPHVVPIYIGDDISDESAFKTLRGRGIPILVADEYVTRGTDAMLKLRNPFEVGKFLLHLSRHEGLCEE